MQILKTMNFHAKNNQIYQHSNNKYVGDDVVPKRDHNGSFLIVVVGELVLTFV